MFAQFLLDFGVGTLTFSEADNILESPDGCSVTFTSVRKLADDESFAGPESAFSDVFN